MKSIQKGFLYFLFLLALGCQNDRIDTKVTNDIIACIEASDSSITKNLWKFEQYLIDRKYIIKNSLSSYTEFKHEYLNGNVQVDLSDLHQYMHGSSGEDWFYASILRMSVMIKCINNSALQSSHPKFMESLAYVFSMHERIAAKQLAEENNLEVIGVDYEYNKIPENYMNNRLFRMGVLWSLYPER